MRLLTRWQTLIWGAVLVALPSTALLADRMLAGDDGRRAALRDLGLVRDAVLRQLDALRLLARDRAGRAETVQVLRGGSDPTGLTTLRELGVQTALLYDGDGHLVWSRNIEEEGEDSRADDALATRLSSVLPGTEATGFLEFGGRTLTVCARSVVGAPPRQQRLGTLVLVRSLDLEAVCRQLAPLGVEVEETSARGRGAPTANLLPGPSELEADAVSWRARFSLPGLGGSVAGELEARIPRPQPDPAGAHLLAVLIAVLAAGAVFGLASSFLLNHFLVRRLHRVRGLAWDTEVHPPIRRPDRDDFSRLAQDVERWISKLRKEASAAVRADRDKSTFLAHMNNEIRTPMTSILGYSELLMEVDVPEEQFDEGMEMIRRNGERMLGILNDILDLSKLEAGKVRAQSHPVQLRRVLADAAAKGRDLADEASIEFTVTTANDLPSAVQCDAEILARILRTMVDNAVRSTRQGSVRLDVEVESSACGRELAFSVFDTGGGIPADRREEIFDPVHNAGSPESPVGLALPIAKRLAAVIDADLGVASSLGSGSVFTLRLPIEELGAEEGDAGVEPRRIEVEREHIDLDGMRILLAEDGEDNQRLIRAVVQRAGAEVTVARNGREACDLILGGEGDPGVDLILMDVHMPVLDGYGATEELRRAGCDLPILAVSAHPEAEERARWLAAGCDGFVTKPIRKADLLAAVAAHRER